MRSKDRKILIGKLGKPHGVKGFCYFHYYGSDTSVFKGYENLIIEECESYKTEKLIEKQDRLIIKLKGCNDRNTAENFRNKEVYVLEKDLEPLEVNEFYLYQLEGLTVTNLDGKNYGEVEGILGTNSNEVLIIKPSKLSIDLEERLIPYIKPDVVKEINLESGVILVDWPESF
tara:strand:- start:4143 stop:4661 length:519 start_codon:yes stop_codon:yes gene_type:complete